MNKEVAKKAIDIFASLTARYGKTGKKEGCPFIRRRTSLKL
jgi:hypothetical protein